MARTKYGVETVETDLEIDEKISMQARGWKIQRIGYGVLFVIPLLALLGVFGDGFLSTTKVKRGSSEIEYEKLFRHEARMDLSIRIAENTDSLVRVTFPVDYISKFELQSIFPEPQSNNVDNGNVHYVFDAKGEMDIVFTLKPQHTGTVAGDITVNRDKYHLSQFIYP